MGHKHDFVALVEQAYSLEGDTDSWLARIASAAGVLDDGLGVIAYRLHGDITTIDAFASTNPNTYDRSVVIAATQMLPPEYSSALFPTRAVTTLSERVSGPLDEHPLYERLLKPAGMEDALGLVAADGTDALIVLSVPLRCRKTLSPRERAQLDRLAIHLGAANRLRRRLQAERFDQLDAVLSPDGKVIEARGDAAGADVRNELRSRARDIERARTTVRHEDDLEALELWQGLVAGRWSICDHFDTDGRRFLIVRENDPRFPSEAGLSQRETQLLELYGRGQSQKLIAYELGVSPTAVSLGLREVARKLGAVSLAELAAIANKMRELRSSSDGACRQSRGRS